MSEASEFEKSESKHQNGGPEGEMPPLPEDLLQTVVLNGSGDMPLHAQLRRALKSIIDDRCVDKQKFFTEPQLIRQLGVSQATVRRALLDLSRDGLLIRKVAKGSFVNKAAHSGEATVINLFVPEWNSGFVMSMVETFSQECRVAGYEFRIHYTHQRDDASRAARLVQEPPSRSGIILLANHPRATMHLYAAFNDRGYPVVNIDSLVPNYPGSFVDTSNEAIVQIGISHLAELGHRRIVFMINEPEEHGNMLERSVFFEREVARRGLDEARVFHCGTHFFQDSYLAAYQKMEELMTSSPTPTAIFAASDPGAWAALKWLAENDFTVPEQVSVLGFSDDRPSQYTYPALTTIAHPAQSLAKNAIEMVTNPGPVPDIRFLEPELVIRESTSELLKS